MGVIAVQNFAMQYGEKLEPKCDQQDGNTSNFEGLSNLNLKVDQFES
jgi:hypothetical protein